MLATIGRSAAVARIASVETAGFFAWILWLVVHIAWLIGFRNRVVVLLDWVWAYFTFHRSARVILHPRNREADRSTRPGGRGRQP